MTRVIGTAGIREMHEPGQVWVGVPAKVASGQPSEVFKDESNRLVVGHRHSFHSSVEENTSFIHDACIV